MSTTEKTLSHGFVSDAARSRSRRIAIGIAASFVFAALTWAGANIYIPLQPVPITLQTLFVLLAGSVAGSRSGTMSQVLYVGAGAIGLPIFASAAAGPAVLAGPTGGYLLSFLVAPFVVRAILGESDSLARQIAAFAAGTLVIFAMGVAHLAAFYTRDVALAVSTGLLPFIPGAIVKLVAAVSIHRSWSALRRHDADRRDSQ